MMAEWTKEKVFDQLSAAKVNVQVEKPLAVLNGNIQNTPTIPNRCTVLQKRQKTVRRTNNLIQLEGNKIKV